MQCNFLWNQRRGISKSVCLLSVTQQRSIELRLSRLPSLDEDVFSCESVPEWSFSFSTKHRPPPPIPTKGSVNVWTGLALLSRICQGIGGKGLQASGTKVFSILKPLEVAEALVYLKRREKQKKNMQPDQSNAKHHLVLPSEMNLQLIHSLPLRAGSWDILTSISPKQWCRGEADALLCISTTRKVAQHFKLPPALLLSTMKRSMTKMTAAITSPTCP